jgi:hypothetical protein
METNKLVAVVRSDFNGYFVDIEGCTIDIDYRAARLSNIEFDSEEFDTLSSSDGYHYLQLVALGDICTEYGATHIQDSESPFGENTVTIDEYLQ